MISKHTQSTEDLLPIGDAARLLGVSVGTLRRWDRGGRISSVRTLGGHRRFRHGDIAGLVSWGRPGTDDPASLTAASCAESLRRLLTPPDAQEPAQEPRTGAGGPGVPTEGCEAVSGQQWGVVEAPQDGGE